MVIQSIRCENYKPFAGPAELALGPLTLVFGHNTSGKSALARLPRLALRAWVGSLDLAIESTRYGESFLDLVHGRDPHGAVRLGITLGQGDGVKAVDATWQHLQSVENGSTRFVSRLVAQGDGALDLHWRPGTPPGSFTETGAEPLALLGMLPQGRVPGSALDPAGWRKAAEEAEQQLCYLGPHRCRLESSYASRTGAPLGDDGAGAPQWLRGDAALARAVCDWYRTHLDVDLDLDPQGEGFRLVVRGGSHVLNAAQLGEGAQQALPVVTQLLALAMGRRDASLTIIEQPELHLHDAAQGAMADLLLSAAMASTGPILVETHSEITLLRVRRRIAESRGEWARVVPEDVAIYWVERRDSRSTLARMTVQPDGWVEGWPRTVYDVTFQEVAALQRAARDRKP